MDNKTISRDFYPNMDLIRYILALGVVIAHYNILTGHSIRYIISSHDSVGAFFTLSGFLIYPSFEKSSSLKNYLCNRARRILPPYFFIVIACAIGLASVSTLTAKEYFSSSGFWQYLASNLCFLNWMQPDLPGVFSGPDYYMSAINGSLWTMKIEWCLYFSVPIVIWIIRHFGFDRRKTALFIIIGSILYSWIFTTLYEYTGKEIMLILSRQFFGQLAYFYCGVLIYFYKDMFDHHIYKMLASGTISFITILYFPSIRIFLSPIAISILIMSISLIRHTPGILRHKHNISYEIYLFHFPLIQLLIFTGMNKLPEPVSFSILIATVTILSILCHFTVCLPFLKRKRQ